MVRKEFVVLILIFLILFQFLTPLLNACYAMETDVLSDENESVSENINEFDTLEIDNNEDEINNDVEKNDISKENINDNNVLLEEISEEEQTEENIEQDEIEDLSDKEDNEELNYDEEDNEELYLEENADLGIMLMSGDIFVGNEAEFRNALANHADNIRVRQSIVFTSPIYINYPVRIVDESDDNALGYKESGQSFIIVQNGGSLTLDGMVVHTNSPGCTGMTGINIEAGGTVTFVNSSIVDGGLGNTGILVNPGSNLLLWSCHIVNCGTGILVQGNGSLGFANQEGRQNKFYSNSKALVFDNFNGTCNLNQSNIYMYNNSNCGIYVGNVSGTVNVSTGTYYNNNYAIHNCSGTTNISGGDFYSNGWALRAGGNLNLTGGSIHNNDIGVLTDEANNGSFVMTGGSIYNNTTHAIQHQKVNDGGCTILGGSISGDVYLQKNDNYVNTNSSYPSFTVTPSTYFFKRKLVRTSDNNTAQSEISKITLTPKDAWYKNVSNEYIVLWKNNNIIVRCLDKDVANKGLKINGNIYNGPLCLQGAKFNIMDSNGNVVDTLTTDQNGYAISKALPAETNYKVKQISTLANYNIDNKEETINFTDATYTTNFINEHKKGNLSVTKIDADDNNLKIKGVTFNVYANEVDSPYKKGDLVGTYTTDDSGKINANLWTGSYYLTETNTQNIYNLSTDNYDVNISENNTTEKNITNEKKKDKIEVTVKDEDTDIPLDNITFEILDEDGNVVDTITTDEDGRAISKDLPIDKKYIVIQKDKKDNYVPNDEKIEVDFIKEFGYEDEQVFPINITNKHKEGDILLKKVDFDNNNIILEGFKFELHVQDVDSPYEKDQLVNTYVTDENGEIHIEKIWTGEYYFTEVNTEASKYYRLIEDKIKVTVEENNVSEFTVTNEKQKGNIEINKKVSSTDSSITEKESGTPLADAIFGIYDKDGNEVAQITTDENGYAISEGLPIDNLYTIKEIKAPEWYLKDDKLERNVEFKEDREIITFEWENEAVCAELEIEESGIIETQANDLIRYDITKLENRSNIEIDNFTFEDNIPYEYATLKSLYTGTYNYDKDYTIWYKIKDQENWIQLLNDNTEDGTYNTKKNNYIDFSGINGTITNFKIEFGTVEKDFSIISNDTPFLFVKVNQDVKNKDKWSNIVRLYGTYTSNYNNTINIEDSSEVETSCYAKKLEVDPNNKNNTKFSRKILPKTGF